MGRYVCCGSGFVGFVSLVAVPCKLGLKPFDLSKMIGPFVKAVPR
jgi:hypothetical protein